ncbi:LysM peptidoglycan-binding domain-containing protein [Bacillus mangrovi]|uniref:LysM peptidoglycan-binding domain-containing protein n=1 Tax=Metabacillus mangrovi TaxID=1491830 RepID=A0A7X2S197_9BACI|nr:peptidoglycan endopeptidase [Metabacillus mangrovi]MTH51984.1 LysM peptidoglycan-binding domain-containing protein [Metabacillus mangrovi]
MNHKVLGLTVTAVAGASFFATSASAESVKVQKGDSLWKIANQYNVSINDLKRENELTGSTIQIGQLLKIPQTSAVKKDTAAESKETKSEVSTYRVTKGDSLWLLSRKFGVSVNELKSLNSLKGDTIFLGQILKVKNVSNPVKPAVPPVPSSKPPVSEEQKPGSQSTYKVKPGDSLWKIANQLNVSVAEIKVANQLKSNVIYVNQILKLTSSGGTVSDQQPPQKEQAPSASGKVEKMISEAHKLKGIPYKWAGNTPAGFDCSGFVYYVMNKVTSVSRLSAAGYSSIMKPVAQPQRGDFVYFTTYKAGPSHMGIYLGNGEFIHASGSQGITVSSMSNSYWKKTYLGAKRYF